MKTLVIVSHPYFERSHFIKALQQTAESLPNVTVRNLESLYGHDVKAFDIAAEQQAHEAADRIMYLFPVHWFNLTPMLKAYLNEVWAYGWAFGSGTALKGKTLQLVVTAGGSEQNYQAGFDSMDTVLMPMKISADYVGMQYLPALAFYDAKEPTDATLKAMQQTFADYLKQTEV